MFHPEYIVGGKNECPPKPDTHHTTRQSNNHKIINALQKFESCFARLEHDKNNSNLRAAAVVTTTTPSLEMESISVELGIKVDLEEAGRRLIQMIAPLHIAQSQPQSISLVRRRRREEGQQEEGKEV